MSLTEKDVPRENLFLVGIVINETTRDLFHIGMPRRPFVINRAEALNLIGYLITQADFTVKDIEETIKLVEKEPALNIFQIRASESQAMIETPTQARVYPAHYGRVQRDGLLFAAEVGAFLFTMEEGKILCASLVVLMGIKPKELDAAVTAVFEKSRGVSGEGESAEDIEKRILS